MSNEPLDNLGEVVVDDMELADNLTQADRINRIALRLRIMGDCVDEHYGHILPQQKQPDLLVVNKGFLIFIAAVGLTMAAIALNN